MARPVGTFTKVNLAKLDEACKILEAGGSIAKACAFLNISYNSFNALLKHHQNDDPDCLYEKIKRAIVKGEVVWETKPEGMSDAEYFFNLKNRYHWADRPSDRCRLYSMPLTMEGVKTMIEKGEMSIESGEKMMGILLREQEVKLREQEVKIQLEYQAKVDEMYNKFKQK